MCNAIHTLCPCLLLTWVKGERKVVSVRTINTRGRLAVYSLLHLYLTSELHADFVFPKKTIGEVQIINYFDNNGGVEINIFVNL